MVAVWFGLVLVLGSAALVFGSWILGLHAKVGWGRDQWCGGERRKVLYCGVWEVMLGRGVRDWTGLGLRTGNGNFREEKGCHLKIRWDGKGV